MKKNIILIIVVLLASCDDIFENDIANDKVVVIAPANNIVAEHDDVTFLWRTLDGANAYHITIVSPSFGEANYVVADTVLRGDTLRTPVRYICKMTDGNYQWSIRASNSAYMTNEQTYTLTVKLPVTLPKEK